MCVNQFHFHDIIVTHSRGGSNPILHALPKSIRLSPLIKLFHLLSDDNETCTKCISTIEVSFPQVSSKLVKR